MLNARIHTICELMKNNNDNINKYFGTSGIDIQNELENEMNK